MKHQKQPKNVEYFTYLGSIIANTARCTYENKTRIAMAEASATGTIFSPANWT
jgi:hypothetical protein